MTHTVNNCDGIIVVTLRTSNLEKRSRADLKAVLEEAVDLTNPTVLDFGPVEFLDSRGVSLIVYWLAESRRVGGALVLCSRSPRLRAVMELVRLPTYVPVAPSI